MSALRFLYKKVLKRRDIAYDDLIFPKTPRKLPVVLSPEEVTRMIEAAPSLLHRTILMVLYATGIRRTEAALLKVTDIDSERMVIHIHQGKGSRDRDVPMTPKRLEALRERTTKRGWRRPHPGRPLRRLSLRRTPEILQPAAEAHALWPWFFPPVWFSGLYDLMLGGRNPFFVDLGSFALKMLGTAILVFSLTWAAGFRRHYRRTLETGNPPSRARAWNCPDRLIRSQQERAIFDFSGETLARSQKHQFFLATYLSVGFSIALLFAIAVRGGKMIWSDDGVRSFPFIITFFAISGFRAVFQFPADLASRMTEARWTETSRSATRKRVMVSGLVPALLLVLPFEIVAGEWPTLPFHFAFQLITGALLIEVMFWSFDRVPFTCSYFSDNTNLSILAVLYLYGFTGYSFNMADLESTIEHRVMPALLCFTAGAILLRLSWRRNPAPSPARFDGEEPVIQTLDLS
jgi:hypothetical protein